MVNWKLYFCRTNINMTQLKNKTLEMTWYDTIWHSIKFTMVVLFYTWSILYSIFNQWLQISMWCNCQQDCKSSRYGKQKVSRKLITSTRNITMIIGLKAWISCAGVSIHVYNDLHLYTKWGTGRFIYPKIETSRTQENVWNITEQSCAVMELRLAWVL